YTSSPFRLAHQQRGATPPDGDQRPPFRLIYPTPYCTVSFSCFLAESKNRTLSATTSAIRILRPSLFSKLRTCSRPSTATNRPFFMCLATVSPVPRHATISIKSVSFSPCWLVNGRSTASRNFATATPFGV